jgi:BlaI family penicillinase repressor
MWKNATKYNAIYGNQETNELTKSACLSIIILKGGAVMELTKSEMQIMDVLWASEEPLSRSDLLERSQQKSWKDSSVHILLNGLLQKGAIREAGFVKRSKTYGRTFAPTLTREEYFATTIFSHPNQPEIVGLFEALLKREDITPDQLVQIEELLRQRSAKV